MQKYAIESKNEALLNRWVLALETLPLALNRFITELILRVAQQPSDAAPSYCVVITKMIAFRVGDIADAPLIIKEIGNLVKTFDAQAGTKKRNWKKPLSKPSTMTVSLVAMGGEVPDDPSAIVAKRLEC
jgi:hypothetical protein